MLGIFPLQLQFSDSLPHPQQNEAPQGQLIWLQPSNFSTHLLQAGQILHFLPLIHFSNESSFLLEILYS